MERVLDVYRRPYNAAIPVVCMDETPATTHPRDTRTDSGLPRQVERHDYEYERCAFARIHGERAAGRNTDDQSDGVKTKVDWAQFLQNIAERYRDAQKITLVMDNLNTHSPGALYQAFPLSRRRRYGIA